MPLNAGSRPPLTNETLVMVAPGDFGAAILGVFFVSRAQGRLNIG